jgi:glycogen debranching enzyme
MRCQRSFFRILLEFLKSIWPNMEAAFNWIDNFGDIDGDGFVEYARQSEGGLLQQGWKDSHDSVFYVDGSLARGTIALCEVRAYVFAAKSQVAGVSRRFRIPAVGGKIG